MFGEGDGKLATGPLRDIVVPIEKLKHDYRAAMAWNHDTGKLKRGRARELGMEELLEGWLDG